jgi:hypothetical protein
LLNLRQELPPTSFYYLPKEEAHRRLVELSGEDYGYDDKQWQRWGLEHHQFYPGYEPQEEGGS